MQVSLYKIGFDNLVVTTEKSGLSFLCEQIEKEKDFTKQEVGLKNENFDFQLFYQIHRGSPPKWKNFLESIAKAGSSVLGEHVGFHESFILVIAHKASGNLYAITGGVGHFAIQNFIDEEFGIDILSRLIKKDEKVLKSVKEMSFVGGILGSTKHFRKNFNFYENDGFGKIYQELKASLDYDLVLQYFDISREEFKKESICVAKSSFTINKSITVDQLLTIINGCELIIERLKPVAINSVEKIDKKKNDKLVEHLNQELLGQLWERYQHPDTYEIDFDLCHSEYDAYLTAASYIITRGKSEKNYLGDIEIRELRSVDELFVEIKKHASIPLKKETFEELIQELVISSYSQEDSSRPVTQGSVIDHILGDVSYGKKKYFLIAKNWYWIKDIFIKDLNDSCADFLKKHKNIGLDFKNKDMDEDDYNKQYVGVRDTLVIHKILNENIEACDILKWDNSNLYLYFVKSGFGNSMRDLCYQVAVAVNRIAQDEKDTYLGGIYESLKLAKDNSDNYFAEIGKQTEKISKDKFIALFKGKELHFVLSVWDNAKTERSFENDIEKFNSNIAKFALRDLVRDMRGMGMILEFCQISKE